MNVIEKNNLKSKLIVLSLSPLFLLILIKNHKFAEYNGLVNFLEVNNWLVLIMIFCIVWIIASLFFLYEFKMQETHGYNEGYEIRNVIPIKDAGLNYLLTFIIPMIFDELNCWQNVIPFFLIIIILVELLSKTNLYYANPILTVLGYQIIEFDFVEPPKDDYKVKMIGICPKEINKEKVVKYKFISDNVLCIKQRRDKK